MFKIKVPATTANMGPGFDCIGMALRLYNHLWVEEAEQKLNIEIRRSQSLDTPTDESNLIYKTICGFYQTIGKRMPGLHMIQEDEIPLTRGLGSSAACVVTGVLAGNALSGADLTRDELIQMAAELEGHPDNSTPAFTGGVVAGAMQDGRFAYIKLDTPSLSRLRFAVIIPDFPLSTNKAREVLPACFTREDAVYNISRAALLVAALMSGQFDALGVAMGDRFHQPYRMKLIPHMEDVFEQSMRLGAKAVFLSGAGPTLIAVTDQGAFAPVLPPGWELRFLEPDLTGAEIMYTA